MQITNVKIIRSSFLSVDDVILDVRLLAWSRVSSSLSTQPAADILVQLRLTVGFYVLWVKVRR